MELEGEELRLTEMLSSCLSSCYSMTGTGGPLDALFVFTFPSVHTALLQL